MFDNDERFPLLAFRIAVFWGSHWDRHGAPVLAVANHTGNLTQIRGGVYSSASESSRRQPPASQLFVQTASAAAPRQARGGCPPQNSSFEAWLVGVKKRVQLAPQLTGTEGH